MLRSQVPAETLRTYLRYGGNTIDTSPYYTVSELVLGHAFAAIKDEFPRESFQIFTKVGRYGRDEFDYSPERVRQSVELSCKRLGTDYLDAVYLHDVEFVANQFGGAGLAGFTLNGDDGFSARDLERWGLDPESAGVIRGKGDQAVLKALAALFELKDQGKIRAVGFSGYPLPTLLRLARLAMVHFGRPVDLVQSYCHNTVQNTSLSSYTSLFYGAGVKQIVSASPLSMGLLRDAGPSHEWHPGSAKLKFATTEAVALCRAYGTTLERVALSFGLKSASSDVSRPTPICVGFSRPDEVHEAMEVYAALQKPPQASNAVESEVAVGANGVVVVETTLPSPGSEDAPQLDLEVEVMDVYKRHGTFNWVWAVP